MIESRGRGVSHGSNIKVRSRVSASQKYMDKTICELFAGVGGFRLGFEEADPEWKTVWFSQCEPKKTRQWAHDCYVAHFGDCIDKKNEYHTGEDIANIDKKNIPDFNVLTAGFPCQDYSVAKPLSQSQGIKGEKGVLWWQIVEVLEEKRPAFCVFENVDRLLKSPASQRGRDFGIMLACLCSLGYSAEWRVINAADYGATQKRKRVFIFAYKKDTKYAKNIYCHMSPEDILTKECLLAKAFPVSDNMEDKQQCLIYGSDIYDVSNTFKFDFKNAGLMIINKERDIPEAIVYTSNLFPKNKKSEVLGDILEKDVDKKYFLTKEKADKIKYLKSSKKITRTSKTGYTYTFSEGAMAFPDKLNTPARTLLTSEGSINRSTHVVMDNEKLRILTPVETERIQGFPDNWTNTGMTEKMRYFCMGNALVVPMVKRIAEVLSGILEKEDQ